MLSDEIFYIVIIVFMTVLMALIPVSMQFKIYDTVNNSDFKVIRIRKFAFLFRAPAGISVSKEGVAIPLFVLQIVGYVTAILNSIISIVLFIVLDNPYKLIAGVSIAVFTTQCCLTVLAVVILGIIGKNKKR